MKKQKTQVMVSCSSADEAKKIVHDLLEKRLIACGQIIRSVESFYRWEGRTERAEECLLLLKSRQDAFSAIEAAVLANHSYDVPEIIAMPIEDGSETYLNWIDEQIS